MELMTIQLMEVQSDLQMVMLMTALWWELWNATQLVHEMVSTNESLSDCQKEQVMDIQMIQ